MGQMGWPQLNGYACTPTRRGPAPRFPVAETTDTQHIAEVATITVSPTLPLHAGHQSNVVARQCNYLHGSGTDEPHRVIGSVTPARLSS